MSTRARAGVAVVLGIGTLSGCEAVVAPTAARPIRAAFYYPWFPRRGCSRGRTRSRTTCRAGGSTTPTSRPCRRRSPTCSSPTCPSASRPGSAGGARPTSAGRCSCEAARARVRLGAVLRAGGHRRPAAAADRRRPALPVGALPRQRRGLVLRGRAGHGRLRLQRRRRHAGEGLRHGQPLDGGAGAAARPATASASTSTSRCSRGPRAARRAAIDGWHQYGPASPTRLRRGARGRRLRDLAGLLEVGRGLRRPARSWPATAPGGRRASRACRPPVRRGSSSPPTTSGARARWSRVRRAVARRPRWARCAPGATARRVGAAVRPA